MTAPAILLCVVCQVFLVSGQLFFKRAMSPSPAPLTPGPARAIRARRRRVAGLLALGVGTQAAWFFLWIKLMEDWKMTQLYVFEGLNPALLALAAALVLRERLPAIAWVGLALICAGIVIVSSS